jgi:hypothetical protein
MVQRTGVNLQLLCTLEGSGMENYNGLMNDLKDQLYKGGIQKAYRYIFEIFSDVGTEIKNNQTIIINTNSLYHGYLDMTYLPVTTDVLKKNGLKIAIVFNYTLFQFEIWLSAVNRIRRDEILKTISQSKWKKYKAVEKKENADAIIELKINGISDYNDKNRIVSLIINATIMFISDIELFIHENVK